MDDAQISQYRQRKASTAITEDANLLEETVPDRVTTRGEEVEDRIVGRERGPNTPVNDLETDPTHPRGARWKRVFVKATEKIPVILVILGVLRRLGL